MQSLPMGTTRDEFDLARADCELERYGFALDAIAILVWPERTDADLEAKDYLTNLVTRVGVLLHAAANNSQAWDVLRKHVVSNHALSKRVHDLNEAKRHLERERSELAALAHALTRRVVTLEGELEGVANAELSRSHPAPSFDANGAPIFDLEIEVSHVVNLGPVEASHG